MTEKELTTKETITVVFASDNNYAKYLAVTMCSLIANFNPEKFLQIIVFDAGITEESKNKICTLMKDNVDISFIYVDETLFQDYPRTIEHISLATYFRLKLPSLLPDHNKVIYLDVDTLVAKDISPMWDLDIENCSLLGVIEPDISIGNKEYLKSIGIESRSYFYINAGILVFNLDYLRQNDFEKKVPEYIKQYGSKIQYQDQDIINALTYDSVKYMSPKYNFMPMYKNILSRKKRHAIDLLPYELDEIKSLKRSACIYHYCGKRKAWMKNCSHYGFELYLKFLQQTPWKNSGYLEEPNVKLSKRISAMLKRFRIRISSLF